MVPVGWQLRPVPRWNVPHSLAGEGVPCSPHSWLLFTLQALLAPWDLQAFQASPRRSPPSLGPWVPRAGEVFPVHRERWGLRVLQEIQVGLCAGPLCPPPTSHREKVPIPCSVPTSALFGLTHVAEHRNTHLLDVLQVSVGLQARLGPRAEEVCLLFRGSGETKGPWDSRAQSARKVRDWVADGTEVLLRVGTPSPVYR